MLNVYRSGDVEETLLFLSTVSVSAFSLFVIKFISPSGIQFEYIDGFIKLILALILNVVLKVLVIGFLLYSSHCLNTKNVFFITFELRSSVKVQVNLTYFC